jgi:hypothetical protein
MPSFNDWVSFSYITVGFFIQFGIIYYLTSMLSIQDNWLENRCNPMYMPFAENIQDNFMYCIQNVQTNLMPYLLQPIQFVLSMLTDFGGEISTSVNSMRELISTFVGNTTNIFVNIYGAFMGLIIAFQRIVLGIQDMINKLIGVVVTLLYILQGTIDTMSSAWSGPPGQLVRALCFHPETHLRKSDGSYFPICKSTIGIELHDGSIITKVHRFENCKSEILYELSHNIRQSMLPIMVTGNHYIFYKNRWIMVKDIPNVTQSPIKSDILYCLETSSQNIHIQSCVFWDWNDDALSYNKN